MKEGSEEFKTPLITSFVVLVENERLPWLGQRRGVEGKEGRLRGELARRGKQGDG